MTSSERFQRLAAVGVAQARAERAVGLVGASLLGGEAEQAAWLEDSADAGEDGVERADVDEDIDGGDEVVAQRGRAEMRSEVVVHQVSIGAARACPLEHPRRHIDTVERVGVGPQLTARQSRPATEVEAGAKQPCAAQRRQAVGQADVGAVGEAVDDVIAEAGGVLVEQAFDVGAGR